MKTLSLASLGKSAFVGAPIKREIKLLVDGEESVIEVYVRQYNYASSIGDISSLSQKRAVAAARIASCICDEKGKPVFTEAQIRGEEAHDNDGNTAPLRGDLVNELLRVIIEVNEQGKPKSTTTRKSGTNSSSTGSAAKRSRKPRKTSVAASSDSGSPTETSAEASTSEAG